MCFRMTTRACMQDLKRSRADYFDVDRYVIIVIQLLRFC